MQKLIDGLHKFCSEVVPRRRDFFTALASGQRPETLFITCSDSRINPNLLTQTDPGDLFILRNAGNLIPAYSPQSCGEAATIEFAVQHLGVRHIVVCGHTECGAMKALLDPASLAGSPAIATWLKHAEATRRHVSENYSHLEGDALATVLAEENVLSQLESLRTHPCVRTRLARGEIALHGWVYKMQTADVFQFDDDLCQFVQVVRGDAAVRSVVHPLRAVVGL
jgi:carbonic anhydrase